MGIIASPSGEAALVACILCGRSIPQHVAVVVRCDQYLCEQHLAVGMQGALVRALAAARTAHPATTAQGSCGTASPDDAEAHGTGGTLTTWFVDTRASATMQEARNSVLWHLLFRLEAGSAIVAMDRPDVYMPTFRRDWKTVARVVERERAATLKPETREHLTRVLSRLQRTQFVTREPGVAVDPMVWFVRSDWAGEPPKDCATIYLMCAVMADTLSTWTRRLSGTGVLVLFPELKGSL